MKINDNVKLWIAGVVLAVVIIVPWVYPEHHLVVQYDCRLAEISVDYPITVKEQCRKLMEKH